LQAGARSRTALGVGRSEGTEPMIWYRYPARSASIAVIGLFRRCNLRGSTGAWAASANRIGEADRRARDQARSHEITASHVCAGSVHIDERALVPTPLANFAARQITMLHNCRKRLGKRELLWTFSKCIGFRMPALKSGQLPASGDKLTRCTKSEVCVHGHPILNSTN